MTIQENHPNELHHFDLEAGPAHPEFRRAVVATFRSGMGSIAKAAKPVGRKIKEIWKKWELASLRHLERSNQIRTFNEGQYQKTHHFIRGLL